jgi:hypothetical protein
MISYNNLIWNVRGLNSLARRTVIRGVVQLYHPAVVCFQESKVANVDQALVFDCCGPAYTPAAGTRGGSLLAWSRGTLMLSMSCNQPSDVRFNLVVVYGPQTVPKKLQFLEDLKLHCPTVSPPWC